MPAMHPTVCQKNGTGRAGCMWVFCAYGRALECALLARLCGYAIAACAQLRDGGVSSSLASPIDGHIAPVDAHLVAQ